MIFLTIGTQEPFDRLVKAMDKICQRNNITEVVAQVSTTTYKVKYMERYSFLTPTEFNKFLLQSKLIVSHGGMGTIISALVQQKPILIMPRLVKYNEHRNDHQLATARAFENLGQIHVAYDEVELEKKILLLKDKNLKRFHKVGDCASKDLLQSLKNFIKSNTV